MTGHRVLSWCFGEIELSNVDVFIGSDSTAFCKLVFETLAFLLQGADFFLQGEDGLPLDLEFFSIGVDVINIGINLLGK